MLLRLQEKKKKKNIIHSGMNGGYERKKKRGPAGWREFMRYARGTRKMFFSSFCRARASPKGNCYPTEINKQPVGCVFVFIPAGINYAAAGATTQG